MNNSHPVDILIAEHRVIERVLTALEARVDSLGAESFPRAFFEDALDFFRNFADGCHHFKEEDTLFPALKASGVPEEGGPIGCMLHDHRFGRECMAAIRTNLDGAANGSVEAQTALAHHARSYIAMLRQHIKKEDNVLFLIARHVLTPEQVAELDERFGDPANPKTNAPVQEKYRRVADRLCEESLPQLAEQSA